MFCPKCGATIKDGSKFCPICGGVIKQTSSASAQESSAQVGANNQSVNAPKNSYYEGTSNQPNNSTQESNSKKTTVIAVTVIAVVACVIAAVLLLTGETEEEKRIREASERAESMIGGVNDIYESASAAYDGSAAGGYAAQEATTASGTIAINPFEYIVINYLGDNGSGYINLDIKDNNYGISNVYFTMSGNNGSYSNGDVVKIIFNYTEYSKYHSEYSATVTSYDCTVKGLAAASTYVPATSYSNNNSSSYGNTSSRTVPSNLRTCVSNDYFIIPNADSVYYDESTIRTFTDEQLKYARNEICAYAGRTYKESGELGKYFSGFYWYNPYYSASYFDDNCDSIINKYEKANLDLINAIEKERGVNQ